MPEFRLETVIEATVEACFDLSLSVDAHTASMGPSGERAVGGVTSGQLRLDDTVIWRARHFGIPFRLTSKIVEHERPYRFVDEQQHGPFASWWHEHTFRELGSGATSMVDVIRFRSPLGPVGRFVDRMLLRRYMHRQIRQRNAWLKLALEQPG